MARVCVCSLHFNFSFFRSTILPLCFSSPPHPLPLSSLPASLSQTRTADETVVTLTSQPLLDKMAVLTANGVVYQVGFKMKQPHVQKLVAIVDFHEHYPHLRVSPSGGVTRQSGSGPLHDDFEMFLFQTYIGILHRGVVRWVELWVWSGGWSLYVALHMIVSVQLVR